MMELVRPIAQLSRFEGPVRITVTPGAPASLLADLDRLIPRLQKGEMIEHRDGGRIGQTLREYTGDYTVDEKAKSATLTEEGVAKVEKLLEIDFVDGRPVRAGNQFGIGGGWE